MSAKKKAPPSGGSNLKPFYAILAAIALGGIGWIAYSASGGSAAVEAIDLTGIDDATLFQTAQGVQSGPDDAPLQMFVFSDFTCPGCGAFAQYFEPQLKAEFVEAGKIRFVYYDFPLGGQAGHRHGFLAARAARCAGDQDQFWQYHDVLFARQAEWALARNAPVSQMQEYADLLGLDDGAFEACLKSDQHAEVVSANRQLGERLGVNSTPTVFLGGRSVPALQMGYEEFRSLIQRELGEAGT